MIITSFDIGIENLSYCCEEYHPYNPDGSKFAIHDWAVINLLKTQDGSEPKKTKTTKPKCQYIIKSGQKIGQSCQSEVAYYKEDNDKKEYFCTRHKPDDSHRYYTCANVTLFELAQLAINKLDQIDFFQSDEIILETQPDLNPRMKNLSMLLFNYFILRYIISSTKITLSNRIKLVSFVNSKNKLTVYNGPYIPCSLKTQYARNKFYGKKYCEYIIRQCPDRLAFFNSHKKRDDLADCFLQGAWYLMNNYTPSTSQSQPSSVLQKVEVKKIKLKPNILKLTGAIGRQALVQIRHNQTTSQLQNDYQVTKYRNLKRGVKPRPKGKNYNLCNVKYLIDRNPTWITSLDALTSACQNDSRLLRAIDFFFSSKEYFFKSQAI
jgi:hypothetical protein